MSLYVNSQLVDASLLSNPNYGWVATGLTEIRKSKNDFVFKTTKPRKINPTGVPEQVPKKTIAMKDFHVNEKTSLMEDWMFIEGTLAPYQSRPKDILFHREMVLSPESEAELIFFMKYISRFRYKENGKGASKNSFYKLENRAVEARKELKKYTDDSSISFLVGHAMSPISVENTGSEETIRELASSWGVGNAETQEIDEVKVQLIERVKYFESNKKVTQRGYADFERDCREIVGGGNISGSIRVGATVQRAMEKGIITYNSLEFKWKLTEGNLEICTIPPNESGKYIEYLTKHFLEDTAGKEKYTRIKMSIFAEENGTDDIEAVKALDHHISVKNKAKQLGLKQQDGETWQDLKARIVTKLEERA